MIFVDTSALANVADPNHTIAVERFNRLVQEREILLLCPDAHEGLHNYVIVEATALLPNSLGLAMPSTAQVWPIGSLSPLAGENQRGGYLC